MRYYLAPMEGVTGWIYRRVQHECFPAFDKYFTPFLVPRQKKVFSAKEIRDILPENNEGMVLVPQLLTCRAEDFIRGARMLAGYGYREINLNLGCPSGTVVSGGRGAGFLGRPKLLKEFLDEVFSAFPEPAEKRRSAEKQDALPFLSMAKAQKGLHHRSAAPFPACGHSLYAVTLPVGMLPPFLHAPACVRPCRRKQPARRNVRETCFFRHASADPTEAFRR